MYDVNSIQFGKNIKVDYEIIGETTTRNVTSKEDMTHPDFQAAAKPLFDMILRFCEFAEEMKNRIIPIKVQLSSSEKAGRCCRITFILKLQNSINGLKITTPKFSEYQTETSNCFTPEELNQLELLKDEAFAYAHANKTAQIGLFDGQDAVEGVSDDELS
ncbi:MAG: hypothetical protein AB9883_07905 [Acidaminococcaceae bacterium]